MGGVYGTNENIARVAGIKTIKPMLRLADFLYEADLHLCLGGGLKNCLLLLLMVVKVSACVCDDWMEQLSHTLSVTSALEFLQPHLQMQVGVTLDIGYC